MWGRSKGGKGRRRQGGRTHRWEGHTLGDCKVRDLLLMLHPALGVLSKSLSISGVGSVGSDR